MLLDILIHVIPTHVKELHILIKMFKWAVVFLLQK
jgi:hypothetical protein